MIPRIINLFLGKKEVAAAYLGSNLVYSKGEIEYNEALSIKANAASTIALRQLSGTQTLQYSRDGEVWWNFSTSTKLSLKSGEKVFIRGILSNRNNTTTRYTNFNITGDVHLDGDMRYVWNYENPEAPLYYYCGYKMFYNCKGITSVGEKLLPSTTLTEYCYDSMFEDCTSLEKAPELPATTLANNCYKCMFYGCTKLNYIKCLAENYIEGSNSWAWVFNVAPTGTFVKSVNANDWSIGEDGIPSGWVIETEGEVPIETYEALVIKANQPSEVGLTKLSNYQTLEYSLDNEEWNTFDTTTSISLDSNEKMFVRGVLSANNTTSQYTQFKITGDVHLDGDMRYVWNYENPEAPLYNYCGYRMFYQCTDITSVSEKLLPSITLAMDCYEQMFYYCTSLTNTPELPATELKSYCYANMFYGCASLTEAPELPATTLASYCYGYMFRNCTSLQNAPELPAATLTGSCYYYMFYGCSNLNYIKCLAEDISASNCTNNWVYGVASSGTFAKANDKMGSWTIGTNGIPTGWIIEEEKIPETINVNNALIISANAPSEIGLETLSTYQTLKYSYDMNVWFNFNKYHQFNLNSGDKLYVIGTLNYTGSALSTPTHIQFKITGDVHLDGDCRYVWNYESPTSYLKSGCGQNMFKGCNGITSVGKDLLPSENTVSLCYANMFQNCTNLTNAPLLPAKTPTNACYQQMFDGCSKLNYIECLAEDISSSGTLGVTSYWVRNVAPTGTFVKSPLMNSWKTGTDGIPTGWVVEDYNFECLLIKANAASTIELTNLASNQTLEYSRDRKNWYAFRVSNKWSISANSMFYIRGILSGDNAISDDYTQFTIEGDVHLDGDMRYVWNYQNPDTPLKLYCGHNMFKGCTGITSVGNIFPSMTSVPGCYANMFEGCTSLENAPDLPATTIGYLCYMDMFDGCTNLTKVMNELPATKLAEGCYNSMFDGCTSLTTTPKLPATELTRSCYYSMFRGCTSLQKAPELPATTLTSYCYYSMFNGCTSLTTAPTLPATTLEGSCYGNMFRGCTSLQKAPELPATTLTSYCYEYMFYGCTKLNYIKCLATSIGDSTDKWVSGVAPSGTFVKADDMNNWTNGVNGIPEGWEVINESDVPFEYNEALSITANAPSTIGVAQLSTYQTLKYSYDTNDWFDFDTTTQISLNSGDKVYVRGILNSNNTSSQYTQFSITGDVHLDGDMRYVWNYQEPDTPLKLYCGHNMFKGCTGITSVGENILPSTELTDYCYQYMFSGCTSLTEAPTLPAEKLPALCYAYMFQNCSNLNYIKCLAESISGSGLFGMTSVMNWVSGVASSGTFVKSVNMNSWSTGNSGIPQGWTIQTA